MSEDNDENGSENWNCNVCFLEINAERYACKLTCNCNCVICVDCMCDILVRDWVKNKLLLNQDRFTAFKCIMCEKSTDISWNDTGADALLKAAQRRKEISSEMTNDELLGLANKMEIPDDMSEEDIKLQILAAEFAHLAEKENENKTELVRQFARIENDTKFTNVAIEAQTLVAKVKTKGDFDPTTVAHFAKEKDLPFRHVVIHNVNPDVSEDIIKGVAAATCGEIESCIMINSSGMWQTVLIHFSHRDAGYKALNNLQKYGKVSRMSPGKKSRKLRATNLPCEDWRTLQMRLLQDFRSFNVKRVNVLSKKSGPPTAILEFNNPEDATAALENYAKEDYKLFDNHVFLAYLAPRKKEKDNFGVSTCFTRSEIAQFGFEENDEAASQRLSATAERILESYQDKEGVALNERFLSVEHLANENYFELYSLIYKEARDQIEREDRYAAQYKIQQEAQRQAELLRIKNEIKRIDEEQNPRRSNSPPRRHPYRSHDPHRSKRRDDNRNFPRERSYIPDGRYHSEHGKSRRDHSHSKREEENYRLHERPHKHRRYSVRENYDRPRRSDPEEENYRRDLPYTSYYSRYGQSRSTKAVDNTASTHHHVDDYRNSADWSDHSPKLDQYEFDMSAFI
uniref:RRM domain-containing protein n=1 Tax=Aureoumbra lagunensis TaxID=44058 RepID=A0A7S3NNE4_9STRA